MRPAEAPRERRPSLCCAFGGRRRSGTVATSAYSRLGPPSVLPVVLVQRFRRPRPIGDVSEETREAVRGSADERAGPLRRGSPGLTVAMCLGGEIAASRCTRTGQGGRIDR